MASIQCFNAEILFLMSLVCYCTQTVIIVHGPQSVNAIDGDTVSFSCTVRADEIGLFVNGTAADEEEVSEKGFVLSAIVDIDADTRQRSLTATAMTQCNSTKITCRALTINDDLSVSINFSDPATLLVQGPLSLVDDLSYSFIDSSTVNISWSPPFTLPGTNITGYNISVTSNGTTTNYFTSDSYYVLLLTNITDSPCNEIIITVSGYNGLNGSEIDLLSGIYLPSIPDNNFIIPVHIDVFTEMNGQVHIILRANVSSICPGEYPTLLDLSIQYSNGSLVATHNAIPLVLLSDGLLTTSDMFVLPADHRYTATVTFSNILGDFELSSNVSFRTHSVQSVVQSDIIGPSIVVVCQFAPNTAAVGCLVQLVLIDNESFIVSGSGNRTGNEAVVTLTEVVAGLYQLTAFDIESDQSLSAAFEISSFLISMSIPIPSLIIRSSSITSSVNITQTVTSSTLIQLVTTGTFSPNPSSAKSENKKNSGSQEYLFLLVSVGVALLLCCCVFIITIIIIIVIVHRRKLCSSRKTKSSSGNVIMSPNAAYEQRIIPMRPVVVHEGSISHQSTDHTLQQNPAYAHVQLPVTISSCNSTKRVTYENVGNL